MAKTGALKSVGRGNRKCAIGNQAAKRLSSERNRSVGREQQAERGYKHHTEGESLTHAELILRHYAARDGEYRYKPLSENFDGVVFDDRIGQKLFAHLCQLVLGGFGIGAFESKVKDLALTHASHPGKAEA